MSRMSETLLEPADSKRNGWEYPRTGGYWDEAILPSGAPRRHWRKLFLEVRKMGIRQLNRRWQTGQQLIQTQGITYNLGTLPEGNEYPWPMDPIPLVIDE